MVGARVRFIKLILTGIWCVLLQTQVLADISLERGPHSNRGAIAGALVNWAVAVAVIIIAVLRARRAARSAFNGNPLNAIAANANLSVTNVMAIARPPARTWSVMVGVLQLSFGVLLIVSLTGLLQQTIPRPVLSPGWTIIRPPQEVSALAVDGEIVWAGGTAGLVAIDRRTAQLRPKLSGEPGLRYVKDLLVDHEGNLWIAHGRGLTQYAGGQWKTYSVADGIPSGPALSILKDRDGALWIGTEQGVARYDGQKWQALTIGAGLMASSVDVIFQDCDGVIWLGSASPKQGGLSSYDGKTWRTYSTRDGLAHNSVNAVTQERDGALWFGTGFGRQGGVTKLMHGVWSTWTRKDGLPGEKVRSVFVDQAGRLWLGSEYNGMAVTDGRSWQVLTPKEGLAGWEVKEMVQDPNDVYWLGTENGVSRIERVDWPPMQKEN